MASDLIPNGYLEWLEVLKGRIQAARSRAALAVNSELIRLYHQIGYDILQRQTQQGWGAKGIERVARDLKATFPDMKGFSTTNLKYMRYFAEHCPDMQFGQQPADQLPWPENGACFVVTVYRPDPQLWAEDYKTRRQS